MCSSIRDCVPRAAHEPLPAKLQSDCGYDHHGVFRRHGLARALLDPVRSSGAFHRGQAAVAERAPLVWHRSTRPRRLSLVSGRGANWGSRCLCGHRLVAGVPAGLSPPPIAARSMSCDARQRFDICLSRSAAGDPDYGRIRPGAINAIIAIGIFNILYLQGYARGPCSYGRGLHPGCGSRRPLRISYTRCRIGGTAPRSRNDPVRWVIAEAGLAYVGLSAQPPIPSWGMLNERNATALAPLPRALPLASRCCYSYWD